MITVLVVDDDFRVARIHTAFIERMAGFSVVGVAHSGAEAQTLADVMRPDLILLDLYLPDIFGLDLINQMRSAGTECDIIVISAANESETIQRAVQLGVTNYLLKPFSLTDLQHRLDDYRSQRRGHRPRVLGEQSDIDRIFGRMHRLEPLNRLPKGMSAETAKLVMAALADCQGDLSAQECAEAVGIARVSARRYLEYFATSGAVSVSLRYGRAGRPERRYAVAAVEQ